MESYTATEVLLITGLKRRRVTFLVEQGFAAPIERNPGRGRERRYTLGEVWRLVMAARLDAAGLSPQSAHRLMGFVEVHGRRTWDQFEELAGDYDLLLIALGENAPVELLKLKGQSKAVADFLKVFPCALTISLKALVRQVAGRIALVKKRR